MPVEIKVPSVGESITEGILSRWIKKNGDFVKADEPIVELETDKATQEIYAPASGRLRTSAVEGSTVQVGSVIGSVEEGVAAPASVIQAPKVPTQPQTKAEVSSPAPAAQPPVQPKSTASIQPALSPAARVLAEARGVDPEKLTGSGRGGRIIKEDVLSAATALALAGNGSIPTAAATTTVKIVERETRQRMSAIRLRIAARLIESQQSTASLTTFNEIDMSAVMDLRARHKERFKEKHGVNLGFMSFFLKAAVESLKAYPLVNARIDGADIVFQHFYDIGVAVSTEKGLMVPVVRDCDHKSFADIERDISGFAAKARDGKINVSDLQGGTFTVTNGGTFGSLLSTPILNPPQTAILGMHAIQKGPVVRGDQVVIRPMMYVALTYDHRLIDGREAVYFLIRIKECVENPERLMLEI